MKPQDAYSLAKACGEHVLDAAVARSDMCAISLRPSWIQFENNIEFNVGELVRNRARRSNNFHSYTDPNDLADAIVLALQAPLPGHEVMFVAQPDNVGGWDLAELGPRYLQARRADTSAGPAGCVGNFVNQGARTPRLDTQTILAPLPQCRRPLADRRYSRCIHSNRADVR